MANRTLELNEAIHSYLLRASLRETPVQKALREATAKLTTRIMQVAPEQGQFMGLLLKLMGAKRILEIGTYTGYSTLAMALALPPEGTITTCDVNQEWTDIAKQYWQQASVENKIDLQLRPAKETLEQLLTGNQHGTYDFAFIDANKAQYPLYYEQCLKLVRQGGLIAIDNTLWGGDVADPEKSNASTVMFRQFNEARLRDERIELSLVPIGDGLTLALKK